MSATQQTPGGEVRSHNEDGSVASSAHFENGKLHGPVVLYDEEGRVRQRSEFADGQLHGLTALFEEERLLAEINYANGKRHGEMRSYGPDGTPLATTLFINGKEAPPDETNATAPSAPPASAPAPAARRPWFTRLIEG
jgi:antitoxin component YwqK of YwqJK toxin-antitoxin module